MMEIKMAKEFLGSGDDLQIVNKAEPVFEFYGLYSYKVTKKELEALLDGKCLYADNSEYALLIYFEEPNQELYDIPDPDYSEVGYDPFIGGYNEDL